MIYSGSVNIIHNSSVRCWNHIFLSSSLTWRKLSCILKHTHVIDISINSITLIFFLSVIVNVLIHCLVPGRHMSPILCVFWFLYSNISYLGCSYPIWPIFSRFDAVQNRLCGLFSGWQIYTAQPLTISIALIYCYFHDKYSDSSIFSDISIDIYVHSLRITWQKGRSTPKL